MKYLLPAILIGLVAGSAAGADWIYVDPPPPRTTECTPEACGLRVTPGTLDDPCLAVMEKAMKAMDNYLPSKVSTFTLEVATAMIHKQATDQSLRQMVPIYEAVEKQWDEAKRCWKGETK